MWFKYWQIQNCSKVGIFGIIWIHIIHIWIIKGFIPKISWAMKNSNFTVLYLSIPQIFLRACSEQMSYSSLFRKEDNIYGRYRSISDDTINCLYVEISRIHNHVLYTNYWIFVCCIRWIIASYFGETDMIPILCYGNIHRKWMQWNFGSKCYDMIVWYISHCFSTPICWCKFRANIAILSGRTLLRSSHLFQNMHLHSHARHKT